MTAQTLKDLQEQLGQTDERLSAAVASSVEGLQAQRSAILAEIETELHAENVAQAVAYAPKAEKELEKSAATLVAQLEAFDTAAAELLNATLAHSATVANVQSTAQHFTNGGTAGPIEENRYTGITINGKRVTFLPNAIAGEVGRSLVPVFRTLSLGAIADEMQFLARTAPPLPQPSTQKDA